MRRKLLMALLALGAVGGYAAGFASVHGRFGHEHRSFHERIADECAQAALRVRDRAPAQPVTQSPSVVVVPVPMAPAAPPTVASQPATPSPATP